MRHARLRQGEGAHVADSSGRREDWENADLPRHGAVASIAIPARDPITSAVFYEAVFGWTLSAPDEERVAWTLGPWDNQQVPFRDASGLRGAFVAARGSSSDGILFDIYVDDLESVAREVEARGCPILEPMRTHGGITMARFRDPGGNIVGIRGADQDRAPV